MAFSFANPATNTTAQTTARNPFAPTPSGSTTVRGSLFAKTDTANDSASSGKGQAKKQENDLKASQHELFNQEKYSDMTIKCKTREWKCHRAILCPRCPFFEAACGGQFTESSTRTIDLSDDDETALSILLQYLYTYEITNPTHLPTATSLHLLILGDKYSLPSLHTTGLQNLTKKIARLTPTDAPWAAEWYPQIRDLSQPGTDTLKTDLATAIAKHARDMIKHEAVRELVATNGDLAVLLVEKLANNNNNNNNILSPPTNLFAWVPSDGGGSLVPSFTDWLNLQPPAPAQGPMTTTTTTAASRAAPVVPAAVVDRVVDAFGNSRPRPPSFLSRVDPPPLPPSLARLVASPRTSSGFN